MGCDDELMHATKQQDTTEEEEEEDRWVARLKSWSVETTSFIP